MKVSLAVALLALLVAVGALPSHLEPRCRFCQPPPAQSNSPKEVACDKITKYSVEWFIENALQAKKPKPATCLFYTRGLSQKARDYAKSKAMTTIWVIYPYK